MVRRDWLWLVLLGLALALGGIVTSITIAALSEGVC